MIRHLLILILAVASIPSGAGERLSNPCRDAIRSFFDTNPKRIGIGVAHIQRYRLDPEDSTQLISVVVPAIHSREPSHLADLATQKASTPWPERFVISDGDVSAQMVLVDQRPGSLLSMQLDQILAEMKNRGVALNDSEEILKHLRDHTEDYYSSFGANTLRGNRSKELADHPQKLSQEAEKIFSSHLDEKTSGGVWPMPDTRPLLPFEHYLADPKDTMCFQNAMLASLLLQRLKIPHRFRTGSASFNKPSYEINGHTLIELTDGRILDPTWNFLKSIKRDTKHPKWVKGDTWWWMPHDHYPFVVLDGE